MISLDDLFVEMGGQKISGFGEDAITIPTPENIVVSKKGLDSVAWFKLNPLAQELVVTINLLATSASVKVLKAFEKTDAVVPFRFEWEDLGIYVEALDARVEEKGELTIGTELPEISFEVTIKNFTEIKGI